MQTQFWLKTATQFLEARGIATARLDALVLLEDCLLVDRTQLLAEPTMEIKDAQVAQLQKLLIRRSKHEPLAYIRGRSEFYGRSFTVCSSVLEPRPESETMIELLTSLPLAAPNGHRVKIGDIGTGCGALGITAALELQNVLVDLIDIDTAALKIAKINVDRFTASINVIKSDLLDKTTENYDVLLCNLPYVPDDFQINLAAGHEPAIAIFGGQDGLDLYRRLLKQLSKRKNVPLYLLTESMPPQHLALKTIASDNGYGLLKTDDFIQVFTSRS